MYHLHWCPNQPKRQALAADNVQLSLSMAMTCVTSMTLTKFERYLLLKCCGKFLFQKQGLTSVSATLTPKSAQKAGLGSWLCANVTFSDNDVCDKHDYDKIWKISTVKCSGKFGFQKRGIANVSLILTPKPAKKAGLGSWFCATVTLSDNDLCDKRDCDKIWKI